ncbi:hypothetical protein DE146DRAFT_668064 [Phaeosphaeria sp. MPI-PUGE-AT-0046c]|nr:hypothetical protein DE146DRAFT_668064 [Phaeosphaeria sp. MPI-PUGE-AT-0046c]
MFPHYQSLFAPEFLTSAVLCFCLDVSCSQFHMSSSIAALGRFLSLKVILSVKYMLGHSTCLHGFPHVCHC